MLGGCAATPAARHTPASSSVAADAPPAVHRSEPPAGCRRGGAAGAGDTRRGRAADRDVLRPRRRPERRDGRGADLRCQGPAGGQGAAGRGTSIAQVEELVVFTEHWYGRLAAVWPAPLTVVLPARRAVSAGGATLAVRVPAQPLLRALLSCLGPLTATSANLSGTAPHTSPDAVAAELGLHLAVLLDGGPTPGAPASTLST